MKIPDFKEFWTKWKPRYHRNINRWIKADKKGAKKEWDKLSDKSKIAALAGVDLVEKNEFTPDARKYLKWERWTDEITEPPKPPPIQSARCSVCPKKHYYLRGYDKTGKPVFLCRDCDKALTCIIGRGLVAHLTLAEIEIKVGEGKAKLADAKRSTPKPKDEQLVRSDKQQATLAAIDKLKDNFGKG